MASGRARLLAMQAHWEMSLPCMCLWCRGAWVGFTSRDGDIACFCLWWEQARAPKTVKGEKVPENSGFFPMVPATGACRKYRPIKIDDKKAALLDALGYGADEDRKDNH